MRFKLSVPSLMRDVGRACPAHSSFGFSAVVYPGLAPDQVRDVRRLRSCNTLFSILPLLAGTLAPGCGADRSSCIGSKTGHPSSARLTGQRSPSSVPKRPLRLGSSKVSPQPLCRVGQIGSPCAAPDCFACSEPTDQQALRSSSARTRNCANRSANRKARRRAYLHTFVAQQPHAASGELN